ncbi:MAG: type IV secretion system DNA-binding domain-containing protein [Chloroflexi bacterium]|nr:type IV secretion system DNA-binding domain-containing protein [Chloroflexota bacterium]
MSKQTQIFRVETADFGQLDYNDQFAQIGLLQSFASSQDGDFRLLSYTMPWNGERWRRQRARLARHAPQQWQKQSFQEELRLGARVAQDTQLQSTRHYLIMHDYQAGANELSAWGIRAKSDTPPVPLSGQYAAHINHLYPVTSDGKHDRSRPYAAVIGAHQFKDKWDWTAPLGKLLMEAKGSMLLCLDSKAVSQRKIEFQANQVQADTQEVSRISDQETLTKMQDARYIMEMVTRGTKLHNVRFFVMVLDKSLKRLKERLIRIKTTLSPFMRLTDLKGSQHAAALMFSPHPNPPSMPDTWHNVLSTGMGHMLGVMGQASKDDYKGLYIGIKSSIYGNVTGLKYFNPWKGQKAAHALFVGQTGSGKTVAMQALMGRVAASGAQVIFMEPQGHSERLAHLLGEENVAYNRISHDTIVYNPLDVVADTYTAQFDYFLIVLEFLLNPLSGTDSNRPYRYLSNEEVGAVNEALIKTYEGYEWEELLADQSKTPLLELFVTWLEKTNAGSQMATELRNLYVTGPWAKSFNATSTLSVQLTKPNGRIWPAVVYDLSHMLKNSKSWLPFYYFVLLSSINRESRRAPAPGKKRVRRVVAVDELRYVTGGTRLVEWLADQIATARTFRVAYWLADQNPRTLAGISTDGMQAMADAKDMTSRLHMLGNIEILMSFRLKEKETKVMGHLYPELTNSHLGFLHHARDGEGLMKVGDMSDLIYMELTNREWSHLIGS